MNTIEVFIFMLMWLVSIYFGYKAGTYKERLRKREENVNVKKPLPTATDSTDELKQLRKEIENLLSYDGSVQE